MKLIIAGGRKFILNSNHYELLDSIRGVDEVISGGYPTGVDKCGEMWGEETNKDVKIFPANWKKFKFAAGPIRNEEMAKYADAVALFKGGKGTTNMYKMAKKHSIKIFDWRDVE